MVTPFTCPICARTDGVKDLGQAGSRKVSCEKCGVFEVTGSAHSMLGANLTARDQVLLSGWIYDQNYVDVTPEITSYNLESILKRKVPSFVQRAHRVLLEASQHSTSLEVKFNLFAERMYTATYSGVKEDMFVIRQYLKDEGLIENVSMAGGAYISPRGLMLLDELRESQSDSNYAFVAMWFHESLDKAYGLGIQPGIMDAGYDAVRIDKKEHANKIDDEILLSISASKFLVADFTNHRGGVYFEAGYALGLGKQIIWCCRKDDLPDLHFDIRQYNCIDWSNPEELRERLAARVEALLGPGPNK